MPLALRPFGSRRGAVDGIVTATTADHRFDELIASEAGRGLVVRPDRVVAAVAAGDELGAIAGRLAADLAADTRTASANAAACCVNRCLDAWPDTST